VLRLLIFAGLAYLLIRWISGSGKPKIPAGDAEPKGRPRPTSEVARSAHELLGVEPGASQQEIRRAYQQRIREYHPDKVANLAEELRELAEMRTKEINAAYQELVDK
jgi:DnaJ like chaperone protein